MQRRRASLKATIGAVLVLLAITVAPAAEALAYDHDVRDDAMGQPYFYEGAESIYGWTSEVGPSNGYDLDTEVDCVYNESACAQGTNDFAEWYPDPSPTSWWMCPYVHIAGQAAWSGNYAMYIAQYDGRSANLPQWQWLDSWPPVPSEYFSTSGFEEVVNIGPSDGGTGAGAINADAIDFHWDPYDSNDQFCD